MIPPWVAAMAEQGRRFETTQWSLVLSARDTSSPRAKKALGSLCEHYWYPLYVFVRRQGYSPEDARDLTQGFFARMLEKDYLQNVDREKGRFRAFLIAGCRHFLANERDRTRALKRGGDQQHVSLDLSDAETRYLREPADELTPEKLYLRRWTLTLLHKVLASLRQELASKEKAHVFDSLKVFLVGEESAESYARVATELSLSEGAARVAVHRIRRRYRQLLRDEIAGTLEDPTMVDEELHSLLASLQE